MNVYHHRRQFRRANLERIEQQEAEWLGRAQWVAFSSQWAAKRCIESYGLKPGSVYSIGIFGEIEIPGGDGYAGAKQFAFVSTDFEAKGGTVVLAAFRLVHERNPDASLVIVGAPPTTGNLGPNVVYAGYLQKEHLGQRKRFREILTTSRALVHPTRRDIAPLIIVEAGYFSCPVISTRHFAIPEQVEHQATGLLIENVSDPSVLADAMAWMIDNEEEYMQMRKRARHKACIDHSKEAFGQRMRALVAPLIKYQ
jgi:glycosyltransferase involved in cell wall biosynthesis